MRSRVLLVEDDPDVRFIVEHVLVRAGYEVDATGTAEDAAELLQSRQYDLVIADDRLPDGNGTEIADAATELGLGALVMTGYAFTMPTRVHERYEILLKPLRPIEIVAAVERALSSRRD